MSKRVTDNEAVARELRRAAKVTRYVDRDWTGLMSHAAAALEAKLAAEREALAKALCRIMGERENGHSFDLWCQRVDLLFASGVLVRVPTREEIIRAVSGKMDVIPAVDAPHSVIQEIRHGWIAEAVLALFEPEKAPPGGEP